MFLCCSSFQFSPWGLRIHHLKSQKLERVSWVLFKKHVFNLPSFLLCLIKQKKICKEKTRKIRHCGFQKFWDSKNFSKLLFRGRRFTKKNCNSLRWSPQKKNVWKFFGARTQNFFLCLMFVFFFVLKFCESLYEPRFTFIKNESKTFIIWISLQKNEGVKNPKWFPFWKKEFFSRWWNQTFVCSHLTSTKNRLEMEIAFYDSLFFFFERGPRV